MIRPHTLLPIPALLMGPTTCTATPIRTLVMQTPTDSTHHSIRMCPLIIRGTVPKTIRAIVLKTIRAIVLKTILETVPKTMGLLKQWQFHRTPGDHASLVLRNCEHHLDISFHSLYSSIC